MFMYFKQWKESIKCRKPLQNLSLQLTYKSYKHIKGFEDIGYKLSFFTQSKLPWSQCPRITTLSTLSNTNGTQTYMGSLIQNFNLIHVTIY